MRYVRYLILIAMGLFLAGCQSNMLKRYEKIQTGMDKDDVLILMGSPKYSDRSSGHDRWGYVFYQDEQKFEKEVHFENERVTYAGDLPKASVPAHEQDSKNETSNKTAETSIHEHRAEAEKAYSDYENGVKGDKQIRYVPQFKPVPPTQ